MTRYLYIIERKDGADYDEANAMLVCAFDVAGARRLASMSHVCEPASEWTSARKSKCEKIGSAHKATAIGVLLKDVNWG